MSITVKSGGDRFTGNWYSDWEGDATITRQRAGRLPRRQPDATRTASSSARALDARQPDRPASTTSTSTSAARSWKQKAWFFYSYRLNDQYKYTLGIDDAGALEADQQLHLQGHVPAQSQQPGDRLPEQAQQAAGAARLRAAAGADLRPPAIRPRATTRGSASGPACSAAARSSTCSPATGTTSSRCDPTDDYGFADDVVPGRIDTGDQPAHRLPRRLSGPEALQAAGLRRDVVLQGRLEGQPRLQGRLRLEARSPQVLPRRSRRQHLLSRSEQRGERARALQLAEHAASTTCVYNAGLHQRHLEVQRPPDAQPRRPVRALRRPLSRTRRSRRTAIAALANWPADAQSRPSARATWRSSRR